MPCRDWSDDVRVVDNTETYKAIRDKLARIACNALTRLEKLGVTDHDEETSKWWTQHKIDDAKAQRELQEKRRAAL